MARWLPGAIFPFSLCFGASMFFGDHRFVGVTAQLKKEGAGRALSSAEGRSEGLVTYPPSSRSSETTYARWYILGRQQGDIAPFHHKPQHTDLPPKHCAFPPTTTQPEDSSSTHRTPRHDIPRPGSVTRARNPTPKAASLATKPATPLAADRSPNARPLQPRLHPALRTRRHEPRRGGRADVARAAGRRDRIGAAWA